MQYSHWSTSRHLRHLPSVVPGSREQNRPQVARALLKSKLPSYTISPPEAFWALFSTNPARPGLIRICCVCSACQALCCLACCLPAACLCLLASLAADAPQRPCSHVPWRTRSRGSEEVAWRSPCSQLPTTSVNCATSCGGPTPKGSESMLCLSQAANVAAHALIDSV